MSSTATLGGINVMSLAQYKTAVKNDANLCFVEDDAPVEAVQALGSLSANTTIDCAYGNIATMLIAAALTLELTASAGTNQCRTLTLIITNGGAYTITWPTGVKWAGGAAPTLTASGIDVLTFMTVDGGATWLGAANGVSFA